MHPSVIERFARCAPGLSPVARRTLRTNLRFIARRVVPQLYPADVPLPRERAKAPYSPAEIDGYLALADAQPTTGRRMRAAGLVCLGAGAGLIRADLRDVRGTGRGRPLRRAGGSRPRRPAAGGAGAGALSRAAAGRSALRRGRAGLRRGRSRPAEPDEPADHRAGRRGRAAPAGHRRLRATWLGDCAELLGLATFMAAAGISCSQRLGNLVAGLEPPARPTRCCCSGRPAGHDPAARPGGDHRPLRHRAADRGLLPIGVRARQLLVRTLLLGMLLVLADRRPAHLTRGPSGTDQRCPRRTSGGSA